MSEKTYYPTIGLEVHAELSTKSKMFCSDQNDPFEAGPNTLISPISLAHPGTLPVPNVEAIGDVIRVGLAVGGTIVDKTTFDRKNYFYPDIPKSYQISQHKNPIVSGGSLAGFDLERIHLEEDTGTSKHRATTSRVDFNRAGVPLMELVTKPVLHSSQDVMAFAKELQLLLRFLGASEANMEKGEMRIEVNVSISTEKGKLGTKVEVKNINSFSAAARATDYEIARMEALHEAGRASEIVQETRGWNDAKCQSFSQRLKESSEEYRYFPDPDMPPMRLHQKFDLESIKNTLPELPWEMRKRYQEKFGIKDEDIEVFVTENSLAVFFEGSMTLLAGDKNKITLSSNYITSDIVGHIKSGILDSADELIKNVDPADFSALITMISDGDINSRTAKDILLAMVQNVTNDPKEYAEKEGLLQKSNPEELEAVCEEVITENPNQTIQYKEGKETLIKFFVGQAMKKTRGSANPTVLEEVFKRLLAS